MATIKYGTSRKTFDETICKTQTHATLFLTGYGEVDDSPAAALYLKREDGTQAFYIPEQCLVGGKLLAVIGNATTAYSATETELITQDFWAYRDASGNVTVVLDPAIPQTEAIATITVTANTTVQGIEFVVSDDTGTPDGDTMFVSARADLVIAYEPEYKHLMKAAGTAALTTAE